MKYAITNNTNHIVHEFDSKEEFIDKTIDIFHECVTQDRRDEDSEAKVLGFNLTECVEKEDGDFEGGEIIRDDNCYNACIRFWEEYGSRCKVWNVKPAFPKALWHWKEEPEYYMDEETGTYSWTNEDGYSVYVDSGGSWLTKEEIDLTAVNMLISVRHEDDAEAYYNDKPLDDFLDGEYTGKDLFDSEDD